MHTLTGGNIEVQVSMYEVGGNLGMDKGAATAMSQDLMIEELVELKTLSGGIGITAKGLNMLEKAGLIAGSASAAARLGKGPVLDTDDRKNLVALLDAIKAGMFSAKVSYPQAEELVIDIKTLETQLLSPRAKNTIVREVLFSLTAALEAMGEDTLAQKVSTFAGS